MIGNFASTVKCKLGGSINSSPEGDQYLRKTAYTRHPERSEGSRELSIRLCYKEILHYVQHDVAGFCICPGDLKKTSYCAFFVLNYNSIELKMFCTENKSLLLLASV